MLVSRGAFDDDGVARPPRLTSIVPAEDGVIPSIFASSTPCRSGLTPERVQFSVFECRFEPDELPALLARLQRELGETNGNVRVYRLCETCSREAVGIGKVRDTNGGKRFLVI